jgi:hypothetical protein
MIPAAHFALEMERRSRMFENKVLGRISVQKRKERRGEQEEDSS